MLDKAHFDSIDKLAYAEEKYSLEEKQMNILLFGGTGFVGTNIVKALQTRKNHVYIVTRSPNKYNNTSHITYLSYEHNFYKLPTIDAVINLAGESLFGYWTKKKKDRILHSRLETTERVIEIIQQLKQKPNVLINSSAIGYYGTSENRIFTEDTTTAGNDFLASVVTKWEQAAKQAETLNIRTVYARFGLILGNGGSLPLMSLPVKLFVGGKVASGNQWISWIHIDDVVGLILYCIQHVQISGPLNFTAPQPMQNKDFMKILAKTLNRPYYFPTPHFLTRTVLGEMSLLINEGQFVLPKRAEKFDYPFKYPKIEKALQDIFQ